MKSRYPKLVIASVGVIRKDRLGGVVTARVWFDSTHGVAGLHEGENRRPGAGTKIFRPQTRCARKGQPRRTDSRRQRSGRVVHKVGARNSERGICPPGKVRGSPFSSSLSSVVGLDGSVRWIDFVSSLKKEICLGAVFSLFFKKKRLVGEPRKISKTRRPSRIHKYGNVWIQDPTSRGISSEHGDNFAADTVVLDVCVSTRCSPRQATSVRKLSLVCEM